MEHRIQVLSVRTSLKNRTITLSCSSDIDEDTVSAETVYLSHYASGSIVPLTYECNRRKIILTMDKPPVINDVYVLVVTNGVQSIVGEPMEPVKEQKVVFESSIVTDVTITKPDNFSIVGNSIDFAWTENGPEEKKCHIYQLQIGLEKSFYNIVADTTFDRTAADAQLTASISLDEANQYFARMRVIKGAEYGTWSQVITFTIPGEKPEPVPNPQPEEKPRPSVPQIIDLTKKDEPAKADPVAEEPKTAVKLLTDEKVLIDDETPTVFEIEFSAPVNIDGASIIVKRRDS